MRGTWIGLCVATIGLAWGCSPDDPPDPPGDDDDVADDDTAADDDTGDDDAGDDDSATVAVAPCEFGDLSAVAIHVAETYNSYELDAWDWYGSVDAWVWAEPRSKIHGLGMFHRVEVEEGDCRYLALDPGGCDAPCDPGELCAADGTCQPVWADPVHAGTLTVTGGGDPVVLEPYGSAYVNGLYHAYDAPADLFGAFDTVTASFSGDEIPAFSISARGVAPMDVSHAGVFWPLTDGQDSVLSWSPGPDPDACVSLIFLGHNAGHGLPLDDIIWCVGPDDGELTIPQAVVEAFPPGMWLGGFGGFCCEGMDCPPSELSRYTRNVIDSEAGPVEMIVRSTVYLGWDRL